MKCNKSRTRTKASKIINPTAWIIASTFLLIGRPRTHSIPAKTACAPSSAGKGKMLNAARFAAINGRKIKRFAKLSSTVVAIVEITVKVPPRSVIGIWNVIKFQKVSKTITTSPTVNVKLWAIASQKDNGVEPKANVKPIDVD